MFKRNLILSAIFGILAISIYFNMSKLLIMNLLNVELPYYLSFARGCLILSITFAVVCICCKRNYFKKTVIRIVAVVEMVVLILGGLIYVSKTNDNYYNGFVEKNLISKNESEIAKLYPYHVFNFSDNVQYGIPIVIRIGSATFFSLTSESQYIEKSDGVYYYVDYFESLSPYMNFKFYMENGSFLGQMRNRPPSYYPQSVEKVKIDGYKVKIYIVEDEYNVFIDGFGKSIYASLKYGEDMGITPQAFAEEVVNQFQLIEKAIDENIFIQ